MLNKIRRPVMPNITPKMLLKAKRFWAKLLKKLYKLFCHNADEPTAVGRNLTGAAKKD